MWSSERRDRGGELPAVVRRDGDERLAKLGEIPRRSRKPPIVSNFGKTMLDSSTHSGYLSAAPGPQWIQNALRILVTSLFDAGYG